MIREEMIFLNEPNEKLKNYISGDSSIVYDEVEKAWTISNPNGNTALLQYTTDKELNVGDTFEVEFTGIDENLVAITTKTEIVGGSWSDGYPMDSRKDDYSNFKKVKIPVKKKGRHILSIGLGANSIGTVKVSNIKIKINTDTPTETEEVDKLFAKIFNNLDTNTWSQYTYNTTGDNCTVEPYSTGLKVTFDKELKDRGNVFTNVEHGGYRVLCRDITKNSVNIFFFKRSDNLEIRADEITEKIYVSVLLM